MKKKLNLADIKAGVLVNKPEKITVEIMVSGELHEFETHIKIMDYSTAIAQMRANQENKEGLASILADCIVDEHGNAVFTEDEIRKYFNKYLIDALWEKIIKKNFLGKMDTPMTNSETTSSGQSLSSVELAEKPLRKPKPTSATKNTAIGESTETDVGA